MLQYTRRQVLHALVCTMGISLDTREHPMSRQVHLRYQLNLMSPQHSVLHQACVLRPLLRFARLMSPLSLTEFDSSPIEQEHPTKKHKISRLTDAKIWTETDAEILSVSHCTRS
jgi:hypothetical protein